MQERSREIAGKSVNEWRALQKPWELAGLLDWLEGRGKEYPVVLEIGSCYGGTFWAFSQLPGVKCMISIDLQGGGFGGGGDEFSRLRIEQWFQTAKPEIEVYRGNRDSHKAETLEEVKEALKGRKVDLLMIDGDHTYAGVRQDFEMYSTLVGEGGVIAFHDVCLHPPILTPEGKYEEHPCQVRRLWQEIKDGYVWKEFISDPTNWGGIGVLEQKAPTGEYICVDNAK